MQTHRRIRVAVSLAAAGVLLIMFVVTATDLPKARIAQGVSDARTGSETCAVPKPSDGSTVILAGIYRSGVISSVAVAGPNYTTHFARIRVADGPAPVIAVVTSYQPMVWSVEGAVDRVERLIVHNALREGAPGRSAGAVEGLPAERVTFISPKCLNNFSSVPDLHAARARGTVAQFLGVDVDSVVGTHTGRAIDLPEGGFFRTEPLIPSTLDASLWRSFGERDAPGGIMMLDVDNLVAPATVFPYEVLPGRLGLLQLLASGHIKSLGERGFHIVRPIPHFPSGMTSGHFLNFLLAPGIPIPSGDPGHSCVISEATREPVSGHCLSPPFRPVQ